LRDLRPSQLQSAHLGAIVVVRRISKQNMQGAKGE
jgi:hypothetical protein